MPIEDRHSDHSEMDSDESEGQPPRLIRIPVVKKKANHKCQSDTGLPFLLDPVWSLIAEPQCTCNEQSERGDYKPNADVDQRVAHHTTLTSACT